MVKRFIFLAVLAAIGTPAQAATMEDEVRAVFDKYIAIQNAHDLKSMRSLLADSPDLLWISRGKPIWGREAALKNIEERYKGTWRIDVDKKELRVISVSRRVAQVYAPTQRTVGATGVEPARNRVYIKIGRASCRERV